MEEYKQKAITVSIKFTSRASIKVKDNFYTVEACEERIIPVPTGDDIKTTSIQEYLEGRVDIEKERKLLWDTVNEECDKQIQEIIDTFK